MVRLAAAVAGACYCACLYFVLVVLRLLCCQSKPISGGIPHCFPQFGPGEMQQHGFGRNLDWAVSQHKADKGPDPPCTTLTIMTWHCTV
jgi:hypothetical protein